MIDLNNLKTKTHNVEVFVNEQLPDIIQVALWENGLVGDAVERINLANTHENRIKLIEYKSLSALVKYAKANQLDVVTFVSNENENNALSVLDSDTKEDSRTVSATSIPLAVDSSEQACLPGESACESAANPPPAAVSSPTTGSTLFSVKDTMPLDTRMVFRLACSSFKVTLWHDYGENFIGIEKSYFITAFPDCELPPPIRLDIPYTADNLAMLLSCRNAHTLFNIASLFVDDLEATA